MKKALPTRLVLASLCAFMVGTVGLSPALAAVPSPHTAQPSPQGRQLGTVDAGQYQVLRKKFTPEEVVALDEVSSRQDIAELVMVIENPRTLSVAASSQPGTVGVYAAPNGCSFSPDSWGRAHFKPACDEHDVCYGSSRNRRDCDIELLGGLSQACVSAYRNEAVRRDACGVIATQYYIAVRAAGFLFYKGTGRND